MNDTYVECLVTHKKSSFENIFKYGMYALAVICFIGSLLISNIIIIPAIIFAAVGYYVSPMFFVEYEYLYVDRSISIDKIVGMKKRRHVADIDLNTMEIMAPYSSHELDSMKAERVPCAEYTSGEENAKVYGIVYSEKEGRKMACIEPNEEMLKAIKMVFPRQVVEY